MSDTVKLIIEITKEDLKRISEGEWIGTYTYDNMILNGTPLDDVKAEIEAKEMVETDTERQFYNMALTDTIQILDNIGKESEKKVNGKNE